MGSHPGGKGQALQQQEGLWGSSRNRLPPVGPGWTWMGRPFPAALLTLTWSLWAAWDLPRDPAIYPPTLGPTCTLLSLLQLG